MKKKAVVSVTNDLATDQRVKRSIEVLLELGFEPVLVGRELPQSMPLSRPYQTIRFNLRFNRGFLFYANYNLHLFFFLLSQRFDLYLSNDLDTLLPNFLVSKLYGKPLVYDSHEYFTGVPEIQKRPVVKWVWTTLERLIFPHLKYVVTVNESIAQLYKKEYGKEVKVVRNISDNSLPEHRKGRVGLALPSRSFVLLNQGAGINVDRGMEEAIKALTYLPEDVMLVIVGDGDAVPGLKKMSRELGLEERVIFRAKQPYLEMLQYTLQCDCGLSLDKPDSPNYRYSLPNKLFDYIKCGLPVVVSSVVEVKKVVENYGIGEVCEDHAPKTIAAKVEEVRKNGKDFYQPNLQRAAAENNWEQERQVWVELLSRFR